MVSRPLSEDFAIFEEHFAGNIELILPRHALQKATKRFKREGILITESPLKAELEDSKEI